MIGFFIGASIATYIIAMVHFSENKNFSIGCIIASSLYAIAIAICEVGE